MRRLLVMSAAVVLLTSCAGDSATPRLPVEASYLELGGYAEVDDDWTIPAHFELVGELTAILGRAPVYRLTSRMTTPEVEQLARALGVRGGLAQDDNGWRSSVLDGSDPAFFVSDYHLFSVSFDYVPETPCNDTRRSEADGLVMSESSFGCVAPTTTTLVPPRPLPSARRAEQLARRAAEQWGIDVSQLPAVSGKKDDKLRVRFIRTVDGLRAKGMEFIVDVDGAGISGAYGFLATPEKVGEVPMTSVAQAVRRLNQPGATSSGRVTVKLRAVEPGLMAVITGRHEMWLVPAYVFTAEDGRTIGAPATQDRYFERPRN